MTHLKFSQPPKTQIVGYFTLIYLLVVIAWGAYVRATGSGAGCGNHWPLCNGQVIPATQSFKTWVEFVHRVSSGLSLLLCLVLGFIAFKEFPKTSLTRKGAIASIFLILLEALLGAGLVLLELVADNQSVLRTVSMAVHLLNTFFLIGAVTLTTLWSSQENQSELSIRPPFDPQYRGWAIASLFTIFGLLWVGSSGAMTALGDTLFPTFTLREGLAADLSPTSHFLVQLRLLHPIFAGLVTLGIILFSFSLKKQSQNPLVCFFVTILLGTQTAELLLGVINLLLLVPISTQIAHLLLADLNWIFLILTLSSFWIIPFQARHERVLN